MYYKSRKLQSARQRITEQLKALGWPERNTFEYVVGWRGAMNDGFAWDVILLVNSIPVGGIVLEGIEEALKRPFRT